MSVPFTPEVTRSLDYLRQGIAEVSGTDEDLSDTMSAIVDDLVVNWENQLMLMFANFNVKETERQDLILAQQQHPSVLAYYNEVKESMAIKQRRVLSPRDPAPQSPKVGSPASQDSSAFLTGVADAPPIGQPHPLGGGGGLHTSLPEVEAHKALSAALYVLAEALAHRVQAERCMVYLAHKGSGSLRVICSVPDISPVQRGAFVATHAGIQGSVFSTSVGIRLDTIDAETMKNYVKPTDSKLGVFTTNSLTFPIVDRYKNPIGVVECANRIHNSHWSAVDESMAFHTAMHMQYILSNFEGVDMHSGPNFNPASLHFITPYQPMPLSDAMREFPGARDARNPQLVARIKNMSQVPIAVKGKQQPAVEASEEVHTVLQVKEIQSYLENIDVSYRHSMADLVSAKEREEQMQDELQKRLHRIRVLESNVNFLHEQLSHHAAAHGEDLGGTKSGAGVKSPVGSVTTLGQQMNLERVTSGNKLPALRTSGRLDASSGAMQLSQSNAVMRSSSSFHVRTPDQRDISSGGGGGAPAPSLETKEDLYQHAKYTLAALKSLALDDSTAKQRGDLLSSPRAKQAAQRRKTRSSMSGMLAPAGGGKTPMLNSTVNSTGGRVGKHRAKASTPTW